MDTTTPEAPERRSEVSYSRVLALQTRAADTDTLLARARERAADPSVFDEYPPLFLSGEISSTRWDAYDTRMGVSTLRNFAEHATAGVAVLRGHRTYEDPVGHSLSGRFIGASGNGVARVESDFYLLADPENESFIRKVRAGTIRDLSVGFYGGEWICSICNKDMLQWLRRDGCPHLLGFTYTPRDEAGQPSGDPQKARATVENAALSEFSPVYDGATPGAMLHKARGLALEGELTEGERSFVQVRYRVDLPDRRRVWPGADLPGQETDMNRQEERQAGAPAAGSLFSEEARQALVQAGLADGDPVAAVRSLVSENGRLRAVAEDVATSREGEESAADTLARLRRQADDGRRWREQLIADALAEGVRAYGSDFSEETYRALLAGAGVDAIRQMHQDFKRAAESRLPGGRVTQDPAEPAPAPQRREATLPAAAFAV